MQIHGLVARFALLIALTLSSSAVLADSLRVDLTSLKGFTASQKTKVNQAADLMERILNSEEFHQAVLTHEFDGKKQFASVPEGMTNEQVYAQIQRGRETYTTADDTVANLELVLYKPPFWKKWSVVGYGYPGKPEIYTNKYYFNSFNAAQVAGNLTHEWLHKIGFEHDFKRTAQRPFSVPYAVGQMIINLAKTMQ